MLPGTFKLNIKVPNRTWCVWIRGARRQGRNSTVVLLENGHFVSHSWRFHLWKPLWWKVKRLDSLRIGASEGGFGNDVLYTLCDTEEKTEVMCLISKLAGTRLASPVPTRGPFLSPCVGPLRDPQKWWICVRRKQTDKKKEKELYPPSKDTVDKKHQMKVVT